MRQLSLLTSIICMLFWSCEKPEVVSDSVYEKISPGDPNYSFIKIINTSPSSPVLNFYFNGSKFTSGLSSSGKETSGLSYAGSYPGLGYSVTTPTAKNVTAKVATGASVDGGVEVLNSTITVSGGKYYSVFTDGAYDVINKKIGGIKVFEDAIPSLDTTKIMVRYINMYNSPASIDLFKDAANGSNIASNIKYGEASGWVSIPNPGLGTSPTYFLYFVDHSTGQTLLSARIVGSLTKGMAYTIYTSGIAGNTTFPITLGSVANFY